MRVWIVQHGQYSDRHVVAVTDDYDVAVHVAELGSGTVTAYELNEFADLMKQGYRRWRVTFLVDGDGGALEAEEDYSPCDLEAQEPYDTSYSNAPSLSRQVTEFRVNARNRDEAIKIASDARRVRIATAKPNNGEDA